jgi:hypothetical protein
LSKRWLRKIRTMASSDKGQRNLPIAVICISVSTGITYKHSLLV